MSDLLTAKQAASEKGVSSNTIRLWIVNGLKNSEKKIIKLKAQKKGGREWLIHPNDLKEFSEKFNMV